MNKVKFSRRDFISGCVSRTILLGTGILVSGSCEPKNKSGDVKKDVSANGDPCDDMTGVSDQDLALRQKLGYLKISPIKDNQCQNCNLFLPPKVTTGCGGCMLFKGPVLPGAYCTYWAPKV